jgi:hypothetical protein
MNYIDREFAEQTRQPAASFSRALAALYEGFALIEERSFPLVHDRFRAAADKLSNAIWQMESLPLVQERWKVRDPNIFPALLDELSAQIGFVPTGDRAVIDHLISELHVLKGAIEIYARHGPDSPTPDPGSSPSPKPIPIDAESQANLIRGILVHAIRLQRIGMLVMQISTVTSQAPRN